MLAEAEIQAAGGRLAQTLSSSKRCWSLPAPPASLPADITVYIAQSADPQFQGFWALLRAVLSKRNHADLSVLRG